MGRIVAIAFAVFLFLGWIAWWHNSHAAVRYDGAVHREAPLGTSSAASDPAPDGREVHPTPSRSDAPGTLNGDPYRPAPEERTAQAGPRQALPAGDPSALDAERVSIPNQDHAREQAERGTEYPQPDQLVRRPEIPASIQPASDSLPPDSPTGERFGGNGVYQWYRQGDLTYRINTRTGQSCIIYATLAEWRKPFVYRHGCRAY